ncbi:MAG: solute carrier family 23 protein [Longibaculum sp.]
MQLRLSAFLEDLRYTTYGENTGVIGLTKIGSVYVTCGAAGIAVLLSFWGKVTAVMFYSSLYYY